MMDEGELTGLDRMGKGRDEGGNVSIKQSTLPYLTPPH